MPIFRRIREYVYRTIAATGRAPGINAIAGSLGIAPAECRAALQELGDAHVLVLDESGETIRFAAPFAGVETPFRVRNATGAWFAPCAWDAFGIAAALHADVSIEAHCAFSDVPLECGVRHGRSYGNALVHMLVPAARFWEDIVYT
jgi:hypothetical protein